MYKEYPSVVHKDNIYVLVYTFLEKALHYVYTAACILAIFHNLAI